MLKRIRKNLALQYQSLIFRIFLYFIISALAVALVLGWNFANRIKPRFNNEILPNLSQYIQYVVRDISTPPDLEKARSLTEKLPFELRIDGADVDWSSTPKLRAIDTYRLRPAPQPYQNYWISRHGRDHLLMLEVSGYRYLFAVDNDFDSGSSHRHSILFAMLAGILLILYLAIRRIFAPVRDISQHLKKIGAGQLDQPVVVKGSGELAQLAAGINDMTVEIKSMLESKAGLLLAISHELRSPITRMRINLELLDDGDKRQVLIRDLGEMEELVSAILESERLNTRHAKLNRSSFNLAELIDEVIGQNFEHCEINRQLSSNLVSLDEVRIRLLVKNLIDNACRYSLQSDKPVMVKLVVKGDMLEFIVSDNGPGVEASELVHLAEAFYRSDSARGRKTGGYGLGLYLCRLIAEAHGGSISFESEAGRGLTVTIRIPTS